MKVFKRIRNIKVDKLFTQVTAVAEKELGLKFRWKLLAIQELIMPLVSVLMPLIVMSFVFGSFNNVGYWNSMNYGLFIILSYQIGLIKGISDHISNSFNVEKMLRTLPGLMIAPIHRFTLLFGIMISKLILIAIPFSIFLVIANILVPCSFLTLLTVLILFFALSILFMGIGTIMAAFIMSKQSIWMVLELALYFIFWLSALNYPIEIFPEFLQSFIRLNPLYYYFDFLRLVWIENDLFFSIFTHWMHVLVILACTIIVPLVALYLFDKVFKKYGIII